MTTEKPTIIDRATNDGVTVSIVRLPGGAFEVMARDASGDDAAPELRTSSEKMARAHFASLTSMFKGGALLGRFWAGSAVASYERAVRSGSVRTVHA